ncbi:ATPase WRNIP1 C26H5.02c [Beauveria bassiana D1-5]|uniref:ATPase WRNIP1 C26H5.02c n=1 Tax=Beauveria bassiana D1-5 TaxID=1245745 RepID=A0A0A2W1J5_BEABA|nr:ATPase WRNIP1 C26H5.02c [Beauveria bassiana D1-5]
MSVDCPICNKPVKSSEINNHIDSGCTSFVVDKESPPSTATNGTAASSQHPPPPPPTTTTQKRSASSFFSTPAPKRLQNADLKPVTPAPLIGMKRSFDEGPGASDASISAPLSRVSDLKEVPPLKSNAEEAAAAAAAAAAAPAASLSTTPENGKLVKRAKLSKAAPLAERMRPTTLDEVCGQELVGPNGVLRSLIESDRVPSMILWGGAGTGKTTIARCIAQATGRRFVEINATSSSVGECKKLFQEAASDLALAGRRTIIFCDEIHRFNKAQQDVFLRPVEMGTVTLIGATTENPSFKVVHALLSRCRTFTLQALGTDDVAGILGGRHVPADGARRRRHAGLPGALLRRRRPHGAQPAGAGAVADGPARRHAGRHQGVADQDARVRPRRRSALRHHLGLSQVGPRRRRRRRPLLPGAHAAVG